MKCYEEQKFQILSNLSQQRSAAPTQPPSEQREMFVVLRFIQPLSMCKTIFDVKRSLAFHVRDLDVPGVKALFKCMQNWDPQGLLPHPTHCQQHLLPAHCLYFT